ncbi:MAG: phospholipase D family protein, partial [Azoarcus sp.]|nr:phospholipase D family protein [Azoarcus sp.]
MRYLDTGNRNNWQECLEYWLNETLKEPTSITELRLQTGYFSLDGTKPLIPVLERFAKNDCVTKVLIGSNDGCTLKNDVAKLMRHMDIPRSNGYLGIVYFKNGIYHPKTYHVRRADGSETAFIGSANLTSAGLSLNVEAAIALDSREGDDTRQISKIAADIDAWFNDKRDGLTVVTGTDTLDKLYDDGILASVPLARSAEKSKEKGDASQNDTHPKLNSLYPPPSGKMPALPEEALHKESEDNIAPVVSVLQNPKLARARLLEAVKKRQERKRQENAKHPENDTFERSIDIINADDFESVLAELPKLDLDVENIAVSIESGQINAIPKILTAVEALVNVSDTFNKCCMSIIKNLLKFKSLSYNDLSACLTESPEPPPSQPVVCYHPVGLSTAQAQRKTTRQMLLALNIASDEKNQSVSLK